MKQLKGKADENRCMRRSSAFLEDNSCRSSISSLPRGFFTAATSGTEAARQRRHSHWSRSFSPSLLRRGSCVPGHRCWPPRATSRARARSWPRFLVIAAAILVVLFLILRRLATTKLFKGTGRVAGVLLGLVEGCLVMSHRVLGLRAFDEPGERLRTRSRLYAPVLGSVPACFEILKPYLPGAGEFRELVGLK